MSEYWLSLTNFPNYEVSDHGGVWSVKRQIFLKQGLNNYGYPHVRLSRDGIQFTKAVHRLVAENFVPGQEDELQVDHVNGVKTDNHYSNLEWVTAKENIQRAWRMGLVPVRKQAVFVMPDHLYFESVKECAEYYNTDDSRVYAVMNQVHKHWRGHRFIPLDDED